MSRITKLLTIAALGACVPAAALAAGPQPGTPEYVQRDNQNMADAYGRQTGPGGQLSPEYLKEVGPAGTPQGLQQLADQLANPTRPAATPGNFFPGWNSGNAFRAGWAGRRGIEVPVAFTNRYGALLRGHVTAPLPGARDPYTGRVLQAPFPAVVITTGSVQGSERMYTWLAQDLAERGYVVITYDVQGQGTSETAPHQGPVEDLPFCDPTAKPAGGEQNGCPGVPSQQLSNFVYGTLDATTFLLSTPTRRYVNRAAGSARVNSHNPLWNLIDRTPDANSVTPGRTTKLAIIGHSLGASAVSWVQAMDRRVETVVALDKLRSSQSFAGRVAKPVVPALGVQSEYFFNVTPYWTESRSASAGPNPRRELATGFDGWRRAGVDAMTIVPRASTHLEYTDINFALPASRYGQALTSVYTQAWLDKYLKHDATADSRLLTTKWRYLEPAGRDQWKPVTLERAKLLSFYYCSAYAITRAGSGRLSADNDVAGVGCQ